MAKRCGRNQKRKLLEALHEETARVDKWVEHCRYAQDRLQEYVKQQQKLHDVGLRVEIRQHYESMGFEVNASLMNQHAVRVLLVREITCARDKEGFIKYIAECIAYDIVKHIQEPIRYG